MLKPSLALASWPIKLYLDPCFQILSLIFPLICVLNTERCNIMLTENNSKSKHFTSFFTLNYFSRKVNTMLIHQIPTCTFLPTLYLSWTKAAMDSPEVATLRIFIRLESIWIMMFIRMSSWIILQEELQL